MNRRKRLNPFYALVVLDGVAFAIIALCYTISMLPRVSPEFQEWFGRHGDGLMMASAILLIVFAALAMLLDRLFSRTGPTGTGKANAFCSFCRKSYRDVGPLVEGPGDVYICGECNDLCQSILDQEKRRQARQPQGDET